MSETVPRFGRRYFSLHICEGFTGNNGEDEKTLLVREDALRKMDRTFEGKPVAFLDDHVTLAEYEKMVATYRKTGVLDSRVMAGIVNRSEYNEADGKHWVEFVVWMPAAIAACEGGMGVSNGYIATEEGGPGNFHDLEYDIEVLDGEYTHLLLTPQPRYTESKTLTPEKFKQYNEGLKRDLAAVTNKSQGAKTMKNVFNILKGEPSEQIDFSGKRVMLEKSKKVVDLPEILNMVDETMAKEEKGEMYANMDHKVKLHDNSICNVGELIEKYKNMHEQHTNAMNELEEYRKATEPGHEHENEHEKEKEHENESPEEKKAREEKEREEKENKGKEHHNQSEEQKKKAKEIQNRVARLKNGPENVEIIGGVPGPGQVEVYTREQALERGRLAMGGSKKK